MKKRRQENARMIMEFKIGDLVRCVITSGVCIVASDHKFNEDTGQHYVDLYSLEGSKLTTAWITFLTPLEKFWPKNEV